MTESQQKFEQKNSPEERAQKAIEVFAEIAIGRVRIELERKYGAQGERYEYHNLQHTERAAALYEKFAALSLKNNLITREEQTAGRLAIWFHDSVMNADLITTENAGEDDDIGSRKRRVGQNEEDSYGKLDEALNLFLATQQREYEDDEAYITELTKRVEEIKVVANESVIATTPGFGTKEITAEELANAHSVVPSSLQERLFQHFLHAPPAGEAKYFQVSQPKLAKNASLTAFNVAVADLGQVGEMTAEEFFISGDSELWESKTYIRHVYENIHTAAPDQLEKVARTVINWIDTQPGFVYGQWQQMANYLRSNAARFASELPSSTNLMTVINSFKESLPNFETNLISSLDRSSSIEPYRKLAASGSFSGEAAEESRRILYELLTKVNPDRKNV